MRSRSVVMVILLTMLFSLGAIEPGGGDAAAARQIQAAPTFTTEETAFTSGDLTLHGTILVPEGTGRRPAIVLVHGAGIGRRDQYLAVAEGFARANIVTLVYDKRAVGYTASGFGPRSYELLAEDALAAVHALRDRPDVDPAAIGLWGFSEGGWVAPLAAAAADEVAFLILTGASAVSPGQQEAWRIENALLHQGVRGSMVRAASHQLTRLMVATGVLSEGRHDPSIALRELSQPVLAIWGERERSMPAAQSAEIFRATFEQSGNHQYTLAFIPNADHSIYLSRDGYQQTGDLAPEYLPMMTSWVHQVTGGNPPGPAAGQPPSQPTQAPDGLFGTAWTDPAGWLQVGTLMLLVVAFGWSLVTSLIDVVRANSPVPAGFKRADLALAGAGLLSTVGIFLYFGVVFATEQTVLGPIVLGRPLPWLILQALALVTLVSTATLIRSRRRLLPRLTGAARVRTTALLVAGICFVPWALYWGLLLP